jgi:hypothetical protein
MLLFFVLYFIFLLHEWLIKNAKIKIKWYFSTKSIKIDSSGKAHFTFNRRFQTG